MKNKVHTLRLSSKFYILIVIAGLAISGITAFPLETELAFILKTGDIFPLSLHKWFTLVYQAIKNVNQNYPFLSYGTDWLAFAHLMLAVLFIGPLKDPVKNKWIIQFGIFCCFAIFPLALIAGLIRHIPVFWQLIDCSFGVFGMIPLLLCLKNVNKIELLQRD